MQNKTWQPAVIIDKYNDRSYSVRTENGATYRRNRQHLIKTNECMPVKADVEMHIPEETSLSEPEQLAIPVTPQPPISPKQGQRLQKLTSLFTLVVKEDR